jgi:hypothetical protein
MKNVDKVTIIEDAMLVAWLSLKKHKITPKRRPDGRIVFEITGNIDSDLEELYANGKVGALDFLKALKTIRSSIFALKDSLK